MTYDSIHKALVSVIKRATGRPAVSYENDKDDQKQGCFKLVEDGITSERISLGTLSTKVGYIVGYIPESNTRYREECVNFIEKTQAALLSYGIDVDGEATVFIDKTQSDINPDIPMAVIIFEAATVMTYTDASIYDDYENNENLENLEGEVYNA